MNASSTLVVALLLVLLVIVLGVFYLKTKKKVVPPPPRQEVYANNGSVSCEQYCGGTGGGPWNNELPTEWNGAKCVDSNHPDGCNAATGAVAGGLVCTCEATGLGWN